MQKYYKTYLWFTELDRSSLNSIESYYDPQVFFKDPFNEINGIFGVKKLFQDMFVHLSSPRFVFCDVVESEDQAFIVWDFSFKLGGKDFSIHGSSHLKFNQQGLIIYHRDYWDVGEELLLKIPFIKFLYAFFRKRFSSH